MLPVLLFWLALCSAAGAQTQADPEHAAGGWQPMTTPAVAAHAMVAAANPHATRAGLEMLRAGGNAVDAAVAALLVLNVVEPQSSGIGGGGFFLIWDQARRRVSAIDGRETAPAAATPGLLLQADGTPQPFYPERITGGRPVGVPGLPRAMGVALAHFGTLGLARVARPAIALAEEGFAVSPRLAESLARHRERLALFPATREAFFQDGAPVAEGSLLRQPLLARTLRLLGEQGWDAFYEGPLARAIVSAVREAPVNPGLLSLADMAAYRAPLREPVRAAYRSHEIVGFPPPTSGGVTLLQILQLLDTQFPGDAAAAGTAGSPKALHRFVQAVRLAYADRGRYLADPDQVPVPVAGLLDEAYARRRSAALDWNAPLRPVVPGLPAGAAARWGWDASPELPSTTHLVVVDAARNVVTVTASVEQAFGSGMVVPGAGFFLNNQLTDFSALPTDADGRPVANAVAPGKRPRSSMAPTLVLREGRPLLALGSPGGARIIQYVAWALVQHLEHELDVQAAVAAPHVTHLGGKTVLEPPLASPATVAALAALGHEVVVAEQNSGLHVIRIDPATGLLQGGADPRREGLAAGY